MMTRSEDAMAGCLLITLSLVCAFCVGWMVVP